MREGRLVRCYDYVNHPYEAVVAAVQASPVDLFNRATAAAVDRSAQLRVKVAGLDLAAEIEIKVVSIAPATSPFEQPATRLDLEWKAVRRPGLFPSMKATLLLYALSPTETQLDLEGHYLPPLGVVGSAADALALHKLAEASVNGFIAEVAGCLRNELGRQPMQPIAGPAQVLREPV